MNSLKLTAATVICLVGTLQGSAQTVDWRVVDSLACDIHTDAALVCREVHFRFRHTCQYAELYNSSYQVYVLSTRLHTLAGGPCSLQQAHAIAHEIDELFHDMEALVHDLKANRCDCRVRPHGHCFGHHFPVNPYRIRKLCALMTCLDGNVHQLLKSLCMNCCGPGAIPTPPVPPTIPGVPVPPVAPRLPVGPPSISPPGPSLPTSIPGVHHGHGRSSGHGRSIARPSAGSIASQPRSRGFSIPIQHKGRTLFSFVIR